MNKDRLNRLADFLDSDAENPTGLRFDMATWGKSVAWQEWYASNRDLRNPAPKEWKPGIDCGTAACAWGAAAISGIFAKEGVSHKVLDDGTRLYIYYGDYEGTSAAREFFNLPYQAVSYLFIAEQYPPGLWCGAPAEKYVAARIRDYIVQTEAGKILERDENDHFLYKFV